MKTLICMLALLAMGAQSQENACALALAPALIVDPVLNVDGEMRDDPAQSVYKSGYAAILAKKWDDARKNFRGLLQKYPKSKYADAASYWLAYSYLQTDAKTAVKHYQEFLEMYPKSQYFNDAVADLEKIGFSKADGAPSPPEPPEKYEAAAARYEKSLQFERQLDKLVRDRVELEMTGSRLMPLRRRSEKSEDPEIQSKVEAIIALGRQGDDAQAYETLKEIALDTTAHSEMRMAALESLLRFKDRDNADVFLAVASSGSTELRQEAIVALGRLASKGDTKGSAVLKKLAEARGEPRAIRMASLVALSERENPGLMTILEGIVKNDADQDLRQEALFFIARAGRSDPARSTSILKSVATNTAESRAIRETAIHALAQVSDRQAFDLLKTIATTDQDKNMRLSALYALGKHEAGSQGEVESLMKALVTRTSEDHETRIAALYTLVDLKSDTYADLCRDLALQEKDEEVREVAVHLLTKSMKDKTKALNTLAEIYGKSGGKELKMKEAALFGIASIGNDKAVDFLRGVAKNDPDYEMRRQAIYFLGSVGGEEAKAALLEILKKK
jgi:HEAT repeat protein